MRLRASLFGRRRVLPGFGLSLGVTLAWTALIVLLPLAALVLKATTLSWPQFWTTVTAPRVLAAFRLSFGASLVAALINGAFGLLVAWVLVRYRFPGRGLLDALIDLPFALPTSIAGLTLTALWAANGPLGGLFERAGIRVAFAPLGVVLALVFVGLPFVVRSVQPVLAGLDPGLEEAAALLGASRWQTFARVVFPALLPAQLAGLTMAFARALGEYGSVVFISGNLPGRTEIAPLLIVSRLEQHDDAGATAIALVVLAAASGLLFVATLLQRRAGRAGVRLA